MSIVENLEKINNDIALTCKECGRSPGEVTLIAVSKTKPMEDITEAFDAGQKSFGENYVQEIRDKFDLMPDNAVIHMIGHLQRNKVKYITDKVVMIHSVDSIRLAEQINKECLKKNIVMPILLEINMAGEESKWGFDPKEAVEAAKAISKLPMVRIKGLMTSAPFVDDPEENRPVFKKMKQLSVDINRENIDNVTMNVLSMGMSGDYKVAISEGATMIRVGTAIFGKRNYDH